MLTFILVVLLIAVLFVLWCMLKSASNADKEMSNVNKDNNAE